MSHTVLDITVKERLSVRPKRFAGWKRPHASYYTLNPRPAPEPIVAYGAPYEVHGVQVLAHEAVYAPTALDPEEFVRISKKVPKGQRRMLHIPGIRPGNRDAVVDVVQTILDACVR
jgi:hypothetical protein